MVDHGFYHIPARVLRLKKMDPNLSVELKNWRTQPTLKKITQNYYIALKPDSCRRVRQKKAFPSKPTNGIYL